MKKPKITITLVEQKGEKGCHRGHKIGDSYDFDTQRGQLCPCTWPSPMWTSCGTAAGSPTSRRERHASAARTQR